MQRDLAVEHLRVVRLELDVLRILRLRRPLQCQQIAHLRLQRRLLRLELRQDPLDGVLAAACTCACRLGGARAEAPGAPHLLLLLLL